MTDFAKLAAGMSAIQRQLPQGDAQPTPLLVSDAVASGQYVDDKQATNFVFAENFDTFDTAAEGGEPDGVVSEADIEAVANSAPGEYPPELVEFARYLLSDPNAGLLDRLDKGAGRGGDDGDISWQDVATVLMYEEPPVQATSLQQAAFVDVQMEAILNAEREGDFDVIETNAAIARVLDNAPVNDPAFATALLQDLGPEAMARVLELAPYAGMDGGAGNPVVPLQQLMAAAQGTPVGEAAVNTLLEHVIFAEAAYDTIYSQVNLILGSAQYGPVADSVLQTIADASHAPDGYLQGLLNLSGMAGTDGVTVAYFQALATNPEAALRILQQYPELLYHAQMEHNDAFVAAVDTLLVSLGDYVEQNGSFEDVMSFGTILDQLGQYGAKPNQAAISAEIERLLPQMVEQLNAEGANGPNAEQIADGSFLAGNLVQRYLAMNAGSDPEACVEAVTALLEGITGDLELTPENYGTVVGMLGAGMLKHFEQIGLSADASRSFWSGLLETASAATGFWASGWGVALGVGFQVAANVVGGSQSGDHSSHVYLFLGQIETMLDEREITFAGYEPTDTSPEALEAAEADEETATDAIDRMLRNNGFAS